MTLQTGDYLQACDYDEIGQDMYDWREYAQANTPSSWSAGKLSIVGMSANKRWTRRIHTQADQDQRLNSLANLLNLK